MTEAELKNCIAAAVRDRDLSEEEIPAIDLYLDQILSLVAGKTADASPRYQERQLTKTMINNYSKDGLISPINGKKYSRDHVIEMLLVYALKNTLSIGEIKRMLTGVREECGFTQADVTAGYRRFLDLKESNRQRCENAVTALLADDGLDIGDDKDFFVALLDIISYSAYLKAVAQELLEWRFEDPDAKEKERREQEKAEKKAKDEQEKAAKRAKDEQEKLQKLEQKVREKKERMAGSES